VACANATFFGLMLGIAYFASGRDLLPLMIVHGMWDTAGM
jgi:membrane protease YdiL (CAAX protease family)